MSSIDAFFFCEEEEVVVVVMTGFEGLGVDAAGAGEGVGVDLL